jgi:hypothetical protein
MGVMLDRFCSVFSLVLLLFSLRISAFGSIDVDYCMWERVQQNIASASSTTLEDWMDIWISPFTYALRAFRCLIDNSTLLQGPILPCECHFMYSSCFYLVVTIIFFGPFACNSNDYYV